jgi:hypothetical protein
MFILRMLSILGTDCKHRFAGLVSIVVKTMSLPKVGDSFECPGFGNTGLRCIFRLVHTVYAPSDPWLVHLR